MECFYISFLLMEIYYIKKNRKKIIGVTVYLCLAWCLIFRSVIDKINVQQGYFPNAQIKSEVLMKAYLFENAILVWSCNANYIFLPRQTMEKKEKTKQFPGQEISDLHIKELSLTVELSISLTKY